MCLPQTGVGAAPHDRQSPAPTRMDPSHGTLQAGHASTPYMYTLYAACAMHHAQTSWTGKDILTLIVNRGTVPCHLAVLHDSARQQRAGGACLQFFLVSA